MGCLGMCFRMLGSVGNLGRQLRGSAQGRFKMGCEAHSSACKPGTDAAADILERGPSRVQTALDSAACLLRSTRHRPASLGSSIHHGANSGGGRPFHSIDGGGAGAGHLVGSGVDCVLDGLAHQGRQLGQHVLQGAGAALKVLLVLQGWGRVGWRREGMKGERGSVGATKL